MNKKTWYKIYEEFITGRKRAIAISFTKSEAKKIKKVYLKKHPRKLVFIDKWQQIGERSPICLGRVY